MRKLTFTCTYEAFLDVTGRKDNRASQRAWLDLVAEVNIEHHETILNEINEAIAELADEQDY